MADGVEAAFANVIRTAADLDMARIAIVIILSVFRDSCMVVYLIYPEGVLYFCLVC